MKRARKSGGKSSSLTFRSLMGRKEWKPLPAVAVLTKGAVFLKELILERFLQELFGPEERDLRRLDIARRLP